MTATKLTPACLENDLHVDMQVLTEDINSPLEVPTSTHDFNKTDVVRLVKIVCDRDYDALPLMQAIEAQAAEAKLSPACANKVKALFATVSNEQLREGYTI